MIIALTLCAAAMSVEPQEVDARKLIVVASDADAPRTQRTLNVADILAVDVQRRGDDGMRLQRRSDVARPLEIAIRRFAVDGSEQLVMQQSARDISTDELTELIQAWMRPAIPGTNRTFVTARDDSSRVQRIATRIGTDLDMVELSNDGILNTRLTDERHAWLDTFLAAQRDIPDFIDLEFVFVTADEKAFDRYFQASSVAMLSTSEADSVLSAARDDAFAEVVHSPRISVFPRQYATISVLDELAYVKDWKIVIVEPGAQAIADPQVDVVRDGFEIDARGTFLDPTHVGVELSIVHSKVVRPIATKKVRLGLPGAAEVEVGLPDVTRVSLETRLRLELGHCALFRAPLTEPDRSSVVFVRAGRRSLPPGEPKER
ncbi:MAG: hypothetical protein HZA52_19365 [Planctomycetes bacterium]|nr:hypothetical protein [Planctomycetota bacterium]